MLFAQGAPFQFYDSPIKSPQKAQASYFSSSFNSMIVRLKVRSLIGVVLRLICFNSMIVRLKDNADASYHEALQKFQFYDSPIKRIYRHYHPDVIDGFQFYDSPIKRVLLVPRITLVYVVSIL